MNDVDDKEVIRQFRYDITRFKNLLSSYRSHIITNRMNTLKHIEPLKIIEEVDNAIKVLRDGL